MNVRHVRIPHFIAKIRMAIAWCNKRRYIIWKKVVGHLRSTPTGATWTWKIITSSFCCTVFLLILMQEELNQDSTGDFYTLAVCTWWPHSELLWILNASTLQNYHLQSMLRGKKLSALVTPSNSVSALKWHILSQIMFVLWLNSYYISTTEILSSIWPGPAVLLRRILKCHYWKLFAQPLSSSFTKQNLSRNSAA